MKFFNYRFIVFLLFCIVASTVAMNLEGATAAAARRHGDGVACRGRGRQNGGNNGGNNGGGGNTNSTAGGTS